MILTTYSRHGFIAASLAVTFIDASSAHAQQHRHTDQSHQQHQHNEHQHGSDTSKSPKLDKKTDSAPLEPIPAITDADRAAAFPDVHGHDMHDTGIYSYFLFNKLEIFQIDSNVGQAWEGQGWIGGDINRIWLRSEGERIAGGTESADLEVFYGRSIARWWDAVIGIRHDFKPDESQSYLAIGLIGLAPQKFEIEATAYVGQHGQSALNIEAEYELLLTNRWILQPLVEADFYTKNQPERGIGRGLSTAELGLRLRYEISRQFAPYFGIVYEKSFAKTADFRRQQLESTSDTYIVLGIRSWF